MRGHRMLAVALMAAVVLSPRGAAGQCADNVVTKPFTSPFLATALVKATFPSASSVECGGVMYSAFTVLVPMSCVACAGSGQEKASSVDVSFANTFVESWTPSSNFFPFSKFTSTEITLNAQHPGCPISSAANDYALITVPYQLGARTGTYSSNFLGVAAGTSLSATWAMDASPLQKSLGFDSVSVSASNVVTGLTGGGSGSPLFSGVADLCPPTGIGASDSLAKLSGLATSATSGWVFDDTGLSFPHNVLDFMLPSSPNDPQDPLVVVDLFDKADGTTRVSLCGVTNDQLNSAAAQDVGTCNTLIEFFNIGQGSSGQMTLEVFLVDASTSVPPQNTVIADNGGTILRVYNQANAFSASPGGTSGEITVPFTRGAAAIGTEYWVIVQWAYPTGTTPVDLNIINQRIGAMTWIASNEWGVQSTYHTGDPHFSTLRGTRLNSYHPGEWVFCSRKDDSIQIHAYHNYDTRWTGHSTLGKIAVKFGQKVIALGRNHVNDGGMAFYVDNVELESTAGKSDMFDFTIFPLTVTDVKSGYVVTVAFSRSGANGVLTLSFNTREVLTWNLITGTHPRLDLSIKLPIYRWLGNTKGYCGGTQRGAVNDPHFMGPNGEDLGSGAAFVAAWAVAAGAAASIFPPLSVAKLDGWHFTTNGQTQAPVLLLGAAAADTAETCGGQVVFDDGVAECNAAVSGPTPDPELVDACIIQYCKEVRANEIVQAHLDTANETCITAGGDHGNEGLEFACAFDFALEFNQTGAATADIVQEYVKHKCPNGCSGHGSCVESAPSSGNFKCECAYPFEGADCSERDICAILEAAGAARGIKAGIVVDRFSSGLDSNGNFVIEIHVPKDHNISLLSIHGEAADRASSGEFFNESESLGLGGFQRVAARNEDFSLAASCFRSYKVTNNWASIVDEVRSGKGGLLQAGATRHASPVSVTHELPLYVKGTSPEGPIDEVVEVDGHIRQLMLINRREVPTDFVSSGARVKTDTLLLSVVEVSPLTLATKATFRLETRSDSETVLSAPTFDVPARFGATTPTVALLSSSQDGSEFVQVWNVTYSFIATGELCEIDGIYTFSATLGCKAGAVACPLGGTVTYSTTLDADSKDFCPHIVERERLDLAISLFHAGDFKATSSVDKLNHNQTAHLLFNVTSLEPLQKRAKIGYVNLEHLFATVSNSDVTSIGFHRGHRHLPTPSEFRTSAHEGFARVSIPLNGDMLSVLHDSEAEVTIWSVLSVELLYGSKARVHSTVHIARSLTIDLNKRTGTTAPPTGSTTPIAPAAHLRFPAAAALVGAAVVAAGHF